MEKFDRSEVTSMTS